MSHDHPGLSRQSVAISRPINPAPRSISRTTASSAASQSGPTTANQDPADALADGINGSAMAVPPPKASTMGLRPENVKSNNSPRKSVAASKSDSTAADVKLSKEVSDRNRELKDALVRNIVYSF